MHSLVSYVTWTHQGCDRWVVVALYVPRHAVCAEGGNDVQNLILVELLCRLLKQAQQDAKK